MSDEVVAPARNESTKDVALRIEGKFDAAIAVLTTIQAQQATTVADHEQRIRALDAESILLKSKVAALEARPLFSPRALLTSVAAGTGAVAAVITTIFALIAHVKIN